MYIEKDGTEPFLGYVDQETNLLAARLDDESLLKEFRMHNLNGVNATVEGNHLLASEHYLVADALGNELARRYERTAEQASAAQRTKFGRFINRVLGISA